MIRKFKLNVPLLKFNKGKIITVKCDDEGIPLNIYWARRLQDSKIDSCIEEIKLKKERNHELN